MEKGAKKGGLLLALMGPKSGEKGEEESGGESRKAAAQAVLDAVDAKDPAMLADAMQTMVDACSMGGGYEDDED